jgi:small subunit ribosomal protein S20
MPITRSAKKALRQSTRRRAQNLKRKEDYKNAVKNFKRLVAAANMNEAKKLIPQLYKTLDKAAKTNVIKKNRAGRLKSRLTKLLVKGGDTPM